MTEQLGDSIGLSEKALGIVEELQKALETRKRSYPSSIEAVLVFSGPGTYYTKLKPEQPEWMRWMDRDRIRAGVAVVREVTAARSSAPFFVYAGIPVENEVFRRALLSDNSKLSKEKVVIVDGVEEEGVTHPIQHTGDQVKSFFQQLSNPKSPLFGVLNVALVSHLAHFIRIPFYLKKYEDEFIRNGGYRQTYYPYPLRYRPGVLAEDLKYELPRLTQYAARGDLAEEPVQLVTSHL